MKPVVVKMSFNLCMNFSSFKAETLEMWPCSGLRTCLDLMQNMANIQHVFMQKSDSFFSGSYLSTLITPVSFIRHVYYVLNDKRRTEGSPAFMYEAPFQETRVI